MPLAPARSSGATLIRTAPFSATTLGMPGAAGRPNGVTTALAGVQAPAVAPPRAATSQRYSLPFRRPVTTARGSADTPSVD